ncbi:isopentenyl-diphosphate Delta-isomerase [Aureibacter tunicatorum]|uniref:Isopentenyl-diphosphate delta-isomerase n=1 Tax=Aureibacter tunicatorum TaxID=866807 RepID=A0AAE3XLA8_9BACT|nr:isopentenyl-diphosphate Delta-isomerase [Aureibacter tunicatorum]MDR6238079.1 isopentenyl-diphosphate delta-isomerase [Aureibacter tunicatorum]BDD03112.1 isopentenyl-diphosphate Delta-isomerase [Aureibacter tunicatorum]
MDNIKSSEEKVVLVDENDREVGACGKMEAHVKGLLHRAFSVFIFNERGELMLQQRALDKYHSGGLWTNTCCSHPRLGESLDSAVLRRLDEEMGFQVNTTEVFSFIYNEKLGNDLIEHEFDHVFVGKYDGNARPNPSEVNAYKWVSKFDLDKWVKDKPEDFTVWFRICYQKVFDKLKEINY